RGAVRDVGQARGRVRERGTEGRCRNVGQRSSVVSDLIHPASLRQSCIHTQSDCVIPAGALGAEDMERAERDVTVWLRRRGALKHWGVFGHDGLVARFVKRYVPAVEFVKRLLLDEGEDERCPPVREAKAARAIGPIVDKGRWKCTVPVVVVVQSQSKLF